MSEIKVNSIKGVGASTAAITVDNTAGTCTANITNNLSNRNLIINGAMQVAQRGTSSTSNGYYTVDRFKINDGGTDEATTKEQVAVTSGGAYDSGFRNCLKITNGNQTSGAGASDYVQILHRVEAQNMANSGWNYTSSSSSITLQFWVKSSVAQVFSGSLRTADGTAYQYKFDTPSLSANTWTKVTKTIPGNSNLTFDNNNDVGLELYLFPFIGTTYTTSNSNTETWITGAGDTYANDMTSTWWTTNDATFEITGVQLEVGSVATDFEHRSFGEELARCQRYYEMIGFSTGTGVQATVAFGMQYTTNGSFYGDIVYKQTMRAIPTLDSNNSTGDNETFELFSASNSNGIKFNSLDGITGQDTRALTVYKNSVSATGGDASYLRMEPDSGKTFGLSAEL